MGAGHREVVDRAVDREIADAATGEEQRPHHVGVGGECDPTSVDVEGGSVVQFDLGAAVERRHEEVLDQLTRQLPPAAVTDDDAVVVA